MEIFENKYVKKPTECEIFEIDNFYKLVLKGGKVKKEGLKERIMNCELLAFYKVNDIIVAISAIKKPTKTYIKDVIQKAKLERDYNDLKFEIGYSFTEKNFRKKGFSSELKSLLLGSIKNAKGILFSTSAISSSQKFLETNGFKNFGIPFDGNNDTKIKYYEINLNE
jgi:hypothetical protein